MKRSGIFLAALVVASHAESAFADDATDVAAARTLGQDGVLLADQGKCPQAIEKLGRAEKLHHAPTTALRLAECEIEVGKVVSGSERLERLVREPLPANAPAVFVAAHARAQTLLASAQPRIALLRISVASPKDVAVTVTVDEETVPAAMLDADRPTDPGLRKIAARAKGYLPATTEVTLKDGEASRLALTLKADPSYVPEKPAEVAGETGANAAPRHERSPLPWIAIGVGVVGLGVGAISGGVVASKASSLDDTCTNKRCPAGSQGAIDTATTWATISTVGFVVGGVGIATGIVGLLLDRPRRVTTGVRPGVTPVVSASYVGIDGRF